jgi:type VI secretion system protein ImpC
MPRSSSLASVLIDVGEQSEELPHPEPDSPFHILIAGDFSGGAGRRRAPVTIDRDNFDDVLARLAPELRLPIGESEVALKFRGLDDFHPDRLFARLGPFQALRDLRRRLADRSTFAAAAAQIAPRPAPPAAGAPANVSGSDLLRMMMGEEAQPAAPPPAPSDWDRMLREMVAPYAEANPDPRQPELIAQTDAAISGQMRAILHARSFQALESAWRGLFFLVRRLETGEDLKVCILDMPQTEVATGSGLAELRRIAVTETVRTLGAKPWAAIAGLYAFGARDEAALIGIGEVARAARAPFLSGLAPDVVGLTRAFAALRRSPVARWIGLALPRFLLRLPYGAATDSTETFQFEEMPSPPEHERYLWANPAIACACLLGEAFALKGWAMRPGSVRDIDGLPLHLYKKRGGETAIKPCAEVLLTEESVELLLECGFMPLVSFKESDRVRLARFQSVAQPNAPLAGRWS